MPLRKRYLFVCTNRRPDSAPKGSCAARGSEDLLVGLKQLLRERDLARWEARACASGCLDACRSGPTIAVEPDHFFYGHVTPEDLPEIVEALVSNRRVERLVLRPDEFEP